MNTQSAQPIPSNGQQPRPARASVPINAAQLAQIADLFNILDGFLRHADGIADHLSDYLHATGHDRPQTPNWTSYDAGLVIDLVSFTAHNLCTHRRKPLQ